MVWPWTVRTYISALNRVSFVSPLSTQLCYVDYQRSRNPSKHKYVNIETGTHTWDIPLQERGRHTGPGCVQISDSYISKVVVDS
jgi:hypothetical protein